MSDTTYAELLRERVDELARVAPASWTDDTFADYLAGDWRFVPLDDIEALCAMHYLDGAAECADLTIVELLDMYDVDYAGALGRVRAAMKGTRLTRVAAKELKA